MKAAHLITATAMLALSIPLMSHAQTCKTDSIEPSMNPDRLIDNNDGTVTDAKTGLIWTQCSLGQTWTQSGCEGSPSHYNWEDALQAAQQFNNSGGVGDRTNWRLPNIKELGSIVERQCESPAINLDFFPDTPSTTYLSSTVDVDQSGNPQGGLSIDFGSGSDLTPEVDQKRHVRLVVGSGD